MIKMEMPENARHKRETELGTYFCICEHKEHDYNCTSKCLHAEDNPTPLRMVFKMNDKKKEVAKAWKITNPQPQKEE